MPLIIRYDTLRSYFRTLLGDGKAAMPHVEKKSKRSRTRKAQVTGLVRGTALALAYEGGVAHATVERIAERSGVAKTTIYRRWPNASAVITDAFFAETGSYIEVPDIGPVKEVFRAATQRFVGNMSAPRRALLGYLLAEAQRDPEFRQAMWTNWIEPRRASGRKAIDGAIERGEIRADVDPDILIDNIAGGIYYRMMLPNSLMDEAFVNRFIEQVFMGLLIK